MLRISSVIFFLFIFLISLSVHSATVVKVKGSKALVDLEDTEVDVGDKLIAINLYGKTKGIVKVHKIKRKKAIVVLTKGKIQAGWVLELASGKEIKKYQPARKSKKVATSVMRKRKKPGSNVIGLLGGGNFNILTVRDQDRLSGLSWKGALFVDITTFKKWIGIRAIAGYNQFLAEGESQGQGLFIHYPGAQVLIKGIFWQNSRFHVWGGLGGALFYPFVDQQMDLNLDERSFKGLHGAASLALGLDTQIGSLYFPVQVDVNWINPVMWLSLNTTRPEGKEFKPLYISFNIGVGFNF